MKERIQRLINLLGYTTARFADEIGVQRSGISHILSGRNQPSYDLLVKILTRFPDISTDWFLLGKGEIFHPAEKPAAKQDNHSIPPVQHIQNDLFSPQIKEISQDVDTGKNEKAEKDHEFTFVNPIERILILHNDGTFDVYHPAVRD